LIYHEEIETYWQTIKKQNLSPELKDLIIRMLSYDAKERPTLEEIKSHSWMQIAI